MLSGLKITAFWEFPFTDARLLVKGFKQASPPFLVLPGWGGSSESTSSADVCVVDDVVVWSESK